MVQTVESISPCITPRDALLFVSGRNRGALTVHFHEKHGTLSSVRLGGARVLDIRVQHGIHRVVVVRLVRMRALFIAGLGRRPIGETVLPREL